MTEVRPLILVVDDESMIRRLVLANLERAGYDVMSAADERKKGCPSDLYDRQN